MGKLWALENENLLRLLQAGELHRALAVAEQSVQLARQQFGEGHVNLAQSLNNLGELQQMVGQVGQARETLSQSLAVYEQVTGAASPETIDTLVNLAELEVACGDMDAACQGLARVAAIQQQTQAPAEERIQVLHRLASIERNLGLAEAALAHLQAAIGLLKESPDQVALGIVTRDLGALHLQEGRGDQAEQLLRQALRVLENEVGPVHPEMAMVLALMAEVYLARQELDVARTYLGQALGLYRHSLGPKHPAAVPVLERLAVLAVAKGEVDQAIDLYRQALTALAGSDQDQLLIARVENDLAECLLQRAGVDEALKLFEASLQRRQASIDGPHPLVAQSLNNLGVTHAMRGDLALGLRQHNLALTMREQVFGSEHPAITQSLENLAAIHERRGRLDKAEPLRQRVLTIWQRREGEQHPATCQARHTLAGLYISQNRLEEAERQLLAARRGLEADATANQPYLATVLAALVEVYRKSNKSREAGEYAARAHALRPAAGAST